MILHRLCLLLALLVLLPTASRSQQLTGSGLSIQSPQNTLTPTLNVLHGPLSGTSNVPTILDRIAIGTGSPGIEQINASPFFVNGFQVEHMFGGASTSGGRESVAIYSFLNGPTLPTNQNRNYVGIAVTEAALTGDGGTPSGPQGAAFAYGGQAILCGTAVIGSCYGTPATGMLEVTWAEANVAAAAGSDVWYKAGFTIAALPYDAVHGTHIDSAINMSNQAGAVGFRCGLCFNDGNGVFPLSADGTVLAATSPATVAKGIDLTQLTFTGNAISTPNFSVDHAGGVFSPGAHFGTVTASRFIAPSGAGVDCVGPPTANHRVSRGLTVVC